MQRDALLLIIPPSSLLSSLPLFHFLFLSRSVSLFLSIFRLTLRFPEAADGIDFVLYNCTKMLTPRSMASRYAMLPNISRERERERGGEEEREKIHISYVSGYKLRHKVHVKRNNNVCRLFYFKSKIFFCSQTINFHFIVVTFIQLRVRFQ